MSQQFPRIDHVVVNVADQLDAALEQYRRLGFTITPRGHHSLGTSNHLAVFGDDYLELIGYEPQNAERAAGSWGALRGLSGLVFKTRDSDGLAAELRQRGVKLDANSPQAFFRPVQLPDGSLRDARFRTVRLDPATVPNGRIFFCHHLDPDLVWRPEWQAHANGAVGIHGVTIEARDPERSIKLLEGLFGVAASGAVEVGWRLTAGTASVEYLRPETIRARFGATTENSPNAADRKVALTLRTASLDKTRQALRSGGIPFSEPSPGLLVVPSSHAFGVALGFVEQAT